MSELAWIGPLRHTGSVPEFCTCGAELPPDASFCHKCGKPQRDEPLLIEETPPALPPPPEAKPAPPPPIDWRNAFAVRLGLMTALLATLFTLLLVLAFPVWLVGAGFLCVYLYQRRTGQSLTVRNGARIGWITGVFTFFILGTLFVFGMVAEIRSGEYLKHANENPFIKLDPAQWERLISNPLYLAQSLIFILVVLFVVFTALPIAGGALGAKMLGKTGEDAAGGSPAA